MKKLFILALSVIALATSCVKVDHAEGQKVTYYPIITLQGDNPYITSVGGSYVDPGYTATLNGEDVSDIVTLDSTVDMSEMGLYDVTYTATNEDGFSASEKRTVIVANPGHIDTVYESYVQYSGRSFKNPFVLEETAPGQYFIKDIMGGYYCLGRYPGYDAYGYDFWAEGSFSINEDNSLTLLNVGSWYFKSNFDYSTFTGSYDPATGIIKWTIEGIFSVTLTPYSN